MTLTVRGFVAGEEGAKLIVGKDKGSVELVAGSLDQPAGKPVTVNGVEVESSDKNASISKKEAGGSAEVKVPTGSTATFGADSYEVSDDATFIIDPDGNVSFDGGSLKLDAGKSLIDGNGNAIGGTGSSEATVSANTPAGSTTIDVPADGVASINDVDYGTGKDGAQFIVDKDGNVSLGGGAAVLNPDENILANGKNVKNTGTSDITVDLDSESGSATVSVPESGKVTIGEGANATEYDATQADTALVIDKDGNVSIVGGEVVLNPDESIADKNGNVVDNTGAADILVRADVASGLTAIAVPEGGAATINGAEYDAAKDTTLTVDKNGNVAIENGAVVLDPKEAIRIPAGNHVQNIGPEKIVVSADDDGNATIDIPDGTTVVIDGVSCIAGKDGATAIIDKDGNITMTGNASARIDNLVEGQTYRLAPGVPTTYKGYVYTAAVDNAGPVDLISTGSDSNPVVAMGASADTVNVALEDNPASNKDYVAAANNAQFALATEADVSNIALVGGSLAFTGTSPVTVDGINYEGLATDAAWTVAYNQGANNVAVGSGKVQATFTQKGLALTGPDGKLYTASAAGAKIILTADGAVTGSDGWALQATEGGFKVIPADSNGQNATGAKPKALVKTGDNLLFGAVSLTLVALIAAGAVVVARRKDDAV